MVRKCARLALVGIVAIVLAACGGDTAGDDHRVEPPGTTNAGQTGGPSGTDDGGPDPGGDTSGSDTAPGGDVVPWDGDPDAEFEFGTVISLPVREPFTADLDVQVQFFGFVFGLDDIEVEYLWLDPSTGGPIQSDTFEFAFALPTRVGRGNINASATNLGPETITPAPQLQAEWTTDAGDHVVLGGSDFPPLPGFGTVQGTMGFGLSTSDLDTWNTDTVVLAIGDSSLSRVTIPLGTRGELVTRMAMTQELDARLEIEDEWIVDLRSFTVQWEDDRFRQTTAGTSVLVVEYEVVESISTFERCTGSNSHYSLDLPWGGTLAASARTPEGTFCVPSGGSRDGRLVYFTVADQEDFSGPYIFEITALGGGSTEFVVSLP